VRPATDREKSSHTELVALQRTLYDSRNPTRRWLHRERLERIRAELQVAAKRPDARTAIEIGPGAGPYIDTLCELFADVTATDIEEEYLDHVRDEQRGRLNLRLLVDDVADSRLDEASFDVVLCSEVIEHTPDPAAVLRGIFRLLRPGGVMILSTPQSQSTVEVLGRIAFSPALIWIVRAIYREPVLPPGHISLLNRRELEGMITETGMRITGSDLSGFYVPLLAEVGGRPALRLEQRMARRLAGGRMAGLLWTQYWTAERPG
jgi:2-polyprenyl-3-methyl-5-hydroxy-6-metoxy-1,4-benzoquinol methylase